jgi:hydantoinase/carbamoylase family amidase
LGVRLPFNLEAIDFTDEEGTLVSFLGSRALCGQLTIANLENPRGDKDVLNIGLERAGLTYESILSARRNPATIGGYLELHVEQGPVLEAEGVQIGIVERISGLSFQRLRYLGEAAHAGSVDMTRRKDAAQGAAAFTLAARQIVIEQFPGCFSNVGDISISPGYFNIIPDLATVEFEFRAADEQQFRDLESALLLEAEAASRRFGLKLEREFIGERLPVAMSEQAIGAIRVAVTNLGLRSMNIVSRAGHDAQAMATICPSGMIFVSSRDGVSHSPKEYTAWNDCVNGANVLLQAALNYPWYQE